VSGIKTNVPLLRLILNEPAFRRGEVHTGYLDDLLKTPFDWNPPPPSGLAGIAALVASKQVRPQGAMSEAAGKSPWLAAGREELLR
jgi:acetyl/propionyl-CoA carboxylase alpha subunit